MRGRHVITSTAQQRRGKAVAKSLQLKESSRMGPSQFTTANLPLTSLQAKRLLNGTG
jgi:hypothetical protein